MVNMKKIKIDLSILPENALDELMNFYNFLFEKYAYLDKDSIIEGNSRSSVQTVLPKPIKDFEPLNRKEIYVR